MSILKKKTRFFKFLFKKIFQQADFIQSISHYLTGLAHKMGTRAEILVIPNPVNLKKFSLEAKERQELRKEIRAKLGLGEEDFVVISVSRLVEKNGVADLIKAVSLIPEIKLLLVGKGDLEKKLKQLSKRLGVENRVIFWGAVSHRDLPKYLAASDIFCRPSLSEGLGTAFLEAMAIGLPIIGTPIGGIPDFLKDGRTGLFCQPANAKDIARRIEILRKDKKLRRELVENGQRLIKEVYDQNKIGRKFKNLFQKMLNFNPNSG